MEDDLVHTAREGDRASVAASIFSMYAYNELSEQLEMLREFRSIYTESMSRPKPSQRWARWSTLTL